MVGEIYAIKNRILEHIQSEAKDLTRVNAKELGEFVDMVKDLAEAEKSCWEASYYKATTEAMENYSGYDMGGMPSRSGYDSYGGSHSGGMRSGYHEDHEHMDLMEMLGKEYKNLGPEERLAMRKRVFATLGIK